MARAPGRIRAALASISGKRKLRRIFPGQRDPLNIWRENVEREKIYAQEKTMQIQRDFLMHGMPFVNEAAKVSGSMKGDLSISLEGIEAPFFMESERNQSAVSISFEMGKNGKAAIIESAGGFRQLGGQAKKPDVLPLIHLAKEIARKTGYSELRLRRPEYSPFYGPDKETLYVFWVRRITRDIPRERIQEEIKRLESEGRPTEAELREMLEWHQRHMRELYYKVARKAGFRKKEGQFLVMGLQ